MKTKQSKLLELQAAEMDLLTSVINTGMKATGIKGAKLELEAIKECNKNITAFSNLTFEQIIYTYEEAINKRTLKLENKEKFGAKNNATKAI